MWKKIIFIFGTILIYLIICFAIYESFNKPQTKKITTTLPEKLTTPITKDKPIGNLIINRINLNEELYPIDSIENNIEKHVTILKHSEDPKVENSTIFIAAHSGTGKIAYFKDLDKLTINDQIILKYKNNTYTYKIKNIWEDKKTGSISIPKENKKQLVLTTCSPTKDQYQLIINSIQI